MQNFRRPVLTVTSLPASRHSVTHAIRSLPPPLQVCRLFGGLYLSPASIPTYFEWLDLLSYLQVRVDL